MRRVASLVLVTAFVGFGSLATFGVGCSSSTSDPPVETDTGAIDTGSVDTGAVDTGSVDTGAVDSGPSCTSPQVECGGACVDTQSDRDHCGACGTACAGGEVCVAGKCAIKCPTGQTECGGKCVSLESDSAHCGACGTTCAVGEVCGEGACALSCGSLATCEGESGGDAGAATKYCANTSTDRLNCGACGKSCAAGEICVDGGCALSCGSDLTVCGASCRDLDTDRNHCGACDHACADGEICSGGTCALSCASPLVKCGAGAAALCTDTSIDPKNCGGCGAVCAPAHVVNAACAAGGCAYDKCQAGFADCNGNPVDGCEIDTNTDAANCGGCGIKCTAGIQSCSAGVCTDIVLSVIEPGNAATVTRARDTRYTIATPEASTIYYTTDGSTPAIGGAKTTAAASPVTLGPLANDTVVRWFAGKSGAPIEVMHTFTAKTDANAVHNLGAIVERVRFDATGGSIVRVAPGATVTGKLNTQWWRSDSSGYCPTCVTQFYVSMDGVGSISCDAANPGTYPGKTTTDATFSFEAPTTPGRYRMRSSIDLAYWCSTTYVAGEEVAVVIVE